MEAIAHDYSPQGVKFYYIYKALAHPELNHYVQPVTLQERLLHIKDAEKRIGGKIPWLCDTMNNDVMTALGNAPTSEFVIDPTGRIVRKRTWGNPQQLRQDLAALVGPIKNPTSAQDINISITKPEPAAEQGVVKRIKVPNSMIPLISKPASKPNNPPLYTKLRADTDQALFNTGNGKMYIGFHLDPIHNVHWNNLTKPLHVELELPPGVTMPETLDGPQVSTEADIDPREFLVDVQGWTSDKPIHLTVNYFACSDDPAFCIPITQHYTIYRELNRRAGWINGRVEPTGPFQATKPITISGKIESIDLRNNTINLVDSNGKQHLFHVSEYTQFSANSQQQPLINLTVGAKVKIDYFNRQSGPYARDIQSE